MRNIKHAQTIGGLEPISEDTAAAESAVEEMGEEMVEDTTQEEDEAGDEDIVISTPKPKAKPKPKPKVKVSPGMAIVTNKRKSLKK